MTPLSSSLAPLSLAFLNLWLHTALPLLLGWLGARWWRMRPQLSTLAHRTTLLVVAGVALASVFAAFPAPHRVSLPAPATPPIPHARIEAPPIVEPNSYREAASDAAPTIPLEAMPLAASSAATSSPVASSVTPRVALRRVESKDAVSKYFGSLDWLGALWLAGSGVLLLQLAACYGALRQWRRRGTVLRDGAAWAWVQHECARQKIVPPLLISSARVVNPFLGGVWKPAIFLPAQWETLFDEEALRAVLQHELAHHARGDTRWLLLAQLLRALLWPQPLGWLLLHSLERNSEDACDNAVLQSSCAPQAYARCLVDVAARLQNRAARRELVAGIPMLHRRSELERRITQIMQGARPREEVTRKLRGGIAAFAMLVTVLSLWVVLEAAPQKSDVAKSNAGRMATAKIVLPNKPLDRSTPQATVESFLRAIQKRDVPMLVACVQNANAAQDLKPLAKNLPERLELEVREVIILNPARDTAWVKARVTARYRLMSESPRALTTLLSLRRNKAVWQITRDNRSWRERRDDPLYWIVRHIANPDLGKIKRWARGRGGASLAGKVLYEDGRPAAGVSLFVDVSSTARDTIPGYASGSDWIMPQLLPPSVKPLLYQQVTTATDGTYRVVGLTSTKYRVAASTQRGDFLRGSSPPPDWAAPAPPLVGAVEARETSVPDIVLTRGALIEVRVVDAKTSQGLANVFVTGGPRRRSGGNESAARTDAGGIAVLRVAEGEARVSLGGEMAQQQRGAFITRTPRGVYALSRNARAQLEDKPPVPFQGLTYLTVEKDTTRRLTIRLQPYVAAQFKPRGLALPPPRLHVPNGGKGRGILIGRVVDESGQPVGNVRVQATMQQKARWDFYRRLGLAYGHFNEPKEAAIWEKTQGLFSSTALSRGDGTFELRGLATAPYDLTTADPGEREGWPNPGEVHGLISPAALGVWARDGQAIRRLQPIILQRGALIRGRVVDKATGEGLGGVYIACYGPHRPQSSDQVASAVSGRDGRFALRVAPGSNQIYVAGPALNEYSGNSVYVDTGARNNAYAIKTQRGPYAGSNGFDYVLDGGPPQTIAGWNQKLVLDLKAGQSPSLELRLRRLRLQPRDEDE